MCAESASVLWISGGIDYGSARQYDEDFAIAFGDGYLRARFGGRAELGVETDAGPFDLTGHPALSMPLALVDGLPQGVVVVGRRFEEARLLAFARICEESL